MKELLGATELGYQTAPLGFMETNTNKIKAIAYCRVSSKEQEDTGYSLDAQEKLLTDYSQEKHYKLLKIFRVTESASKWQIRKTLNEMLSYADKNGVNVIFCEKIDRLTRSLKDATIVDDWVHEKEGREVHFVKEHFILNANTKAHDNFVWDMKVAVARFYTNNLSEEVKKGQKEKVAQGWLPTKPPLGYKTIGEKGHKIHIIDQGIAPYIKKMFETYATGNYSTKALVNVMYKEGLRNREDRRVGKSRIYDLLSDPFYAGKMRWKSQIYQGKQEALIQKELFDTVQIKLKRKIGTPMYSKHLPVFKAMMRCGECEGTVTWEVQKSHWYGHCSHYRSCTQKKYVRQEAVEEQLFPYFDKVAPKSESVVRWLEKALKESHTDEIKYNSSKRDELNRIVASADRRIETAYKDKIDGKMPADLCKKVMDGSTQEKEDALSSLKSLAETRTAYYEAGFAIHELAMKAKDIYSSKKASNEDKRLLLSYVFENNILQDGKITPNYTLAFDFLSEWMPKVNPVFAQTKNPAQSEVFSKNIGHSHETTKEISVDGSSEPRNNFRTSKNPYPIKRFKDSNLKSRDLLRG